MDAGGFENLPQPARTALQAASLIIGPKRHLSMLPALSAQQLVWPIPFSDGIDMVMARRGQPIVMLVSGDPFWFGAGSQMTRLLSSDEWVAWPAASCFSLGASALGWSIEKTICLGLHAAPLNRLRPYLQTGCHIMATLRDGDEIAKLQAYLVAQQFGESTLYVLESLGGDGARKTKIKADEKTECRFSHPVMVGIACAGAGRTMPRTPGLDDDWFEHDGQITKRPVRALTLSALAPQSGQHLWDLGAGSGSISIEWLLASRDMRATAIERHAERANRIERNALHLGVDWLRIIQSENLDVLDELDKPDAVFIGGGLRAELLDRLMGILPAGVRLVANGVTLETDRLLGMAQAEYGGSLTKFEFAQAEPIGSMQGWKASYPITQWVLVT